MDKHDAGGIGGVPRIGVDLDDGAFVHFRAVVGFVFAGVVWVDAVGHVGRDEERGGESLLAGGYGVGDVVQRNFLGIRGQHGKAPDDCRKHV